MGEEIKVNKIDNIYDKFKHKNSFLCLNKENKKTSEFFIEYLGHWLDDERITEKENKEELLTFLDELDLNDPYVNRTMRILFNKYHKEIIDRSNPHYKYGYLQYLLEHHQFELMFTIIKTMHYKADTLQKSLMDEHMYAAPTKYIVIGDKK